MGLYSDVIPGRPTASSDGRSYVTIDFGYLFDNLRLDWSKPFAEQVEHDSEYWERIKDDTSPAYAQHNHLKNKRKEAVGRKVKEKETYVVIWQPNSTEFKPFVAVDRGGNVALMDLDGNELDRYVYGRKLDEQELWRFIEGHSLVDPAVFYFTAETAGSVSGLEISATPENARILQDYPGYKGKVELTEKSGIRWLRRAEVTVGDSNVSC